MAYRRRTPGRRTARRRAPARRATVRRAPAPRRVMRRAPMVRRAYRRRRARAYPARRVMRNKAISAHTTSRGDIIVEKAEYIGDLVPSTTGAFLSQVYNVNPGLTSVFPFLSGLAQQYEEYDPVYMQVILKTTSGYAMNNTTGNAALGTMGITSVYNTYTNTATLNSKVICESYDGATSGPPSKSQVIRLQTKNSRNPLDTYFTRAGPVPANQTSSMTDVCNLVIWSSGLQNTVANAPIAEIWIRYKIILKSPKPGSLLTTSPFVHAQCATATTSAYFGATRTLSAASNFIPTFTGTTVTFPSDLPLGNYLLSYVAYGTSTASVAGPNVAFTTNCALYNLWINNTASALPSISATSTYMTTQVAFTVTGASPVLTFSGGTFPGSGTAQFVDFTVTKIPNGVA